MGDFEMLKRLLPCLVILLLISWPIGAAVTPNSPVTPQTPNRGVVQFLQGTDTAGTYKTLYTAGANGSDCSALWLTTNDGSATHLVTVQIVNSSVKYGGVAITTVESAGFANAVPAMNLFQSTIWPGLPLNSDGNPFLRIVSGDTIQATFATSLTSSTVINLVMSCADY
jgi:hypothetical protein